MPRGGKAALGQTPFGKGGAEKGGLRGPELPWKFKAAAGGAVRRGDAAPQPGSSVQLRSSSPGQG